MKHHLRLLSRGARQLMGDEGSYLPNCQTILVIALHALTDCIVLAFHTTEYLSGRVNNVFIRAFK